MGYLSTARTRTHNLFHPKCVPSHSLTYPWILPIQAATQAISCVLQQLSKITKWPTFLVSSNHPYFNSSWTEATDCFWNSSLQLILHGCCTQQYHITLHFFVKFGHQHFTVAWQQTVDFEKRLHSMNNRYINSHLGWVAPYIVNSRVTKP